MKTILHEMRHSPYCIPVRHAMECFGVPFEAVEVPNWDRRSIAALTGGSYCQVPVLEDRGRVIHDTADEPFAVARHIDRSFCGGTLFPDRWAGINEILAGHIESEVELAAFKLVDIHYVPGICDPGERGMVIRHKERKFGAGCIDAWRRDEAALQAALHGLLAPFDRRLASSQWLLDAQPVFADFALFGILGNYTFMNWNRIPATLPNLARWFEQLAGWSPDGRTTERRAYPIS